MEWSTTKTCADNETCQNGSCAKTCTNACNTKGAVQCSGKNVQTCDDKNGDGCLEWSTTKTCADNENCQNGSCVKTCTNACNTKGAVQCSGKNVQTCDDKNGDGCLEWSTTKTCADNETCQNGSCAKTCTNVCTEKGKVQCSGNKVQQCGDYNKDGCLEWGGDRVCDYGCSKGVCNKVPECTTTVCPILVTKFGEWISGDTSKSKNAFSKYESCHDVGKTDVTQNESGPEEYYMLNLTEPGVLVTSVKYASGIDVDVHILDSLKADSCLARGDLSTASHLGAGIHYVSVDTYNGSSKAGKYDIIFYFIPDSGKCGMAQKTMDRYNDSHPLQMPVAGKVGRESHLVTTHDQKVHTKEEEQFPDGTGWWPQDAYDADSIKIHQEYTKLLFNKKMKEFGTEIKYRTSGGDAKWCSVNSEGKAGHASYGKPLPPEAEAWDVNMYWKNAKPKEGTYYLVFNPTDGKAVIAAAGYETGPGAKDFMGGAVPEIHMYFGTSNGSVMVFGELKNQSHTKDDFGPIDCFK